MPISDNDLLAGMHSREQGSPVPKKHIMRAAPADTASEQPVQTENNRPVDAAPVQNTATDDNIPVSANDTAQSAEQQSPLPVETMSQQAEPEPVQPEQTSEQDVQTNTTVEQSAQAEPPEQPSEPSVEPEKAVKPQTKPRPQTLPDPILPDIISQSGHARYAKFMCRSLSHGNAIRFTMDASILGMIDMYFEHSVGRPEYEKLSNSDKLAAYLYFTSPADIRSRCSLPSKIKSAILPADRRKNDPYGINTLSHAVALNQNYLQELLCAVYGSYIATGQGNLMTDNADITDASVDAIHMDMKRKVLPKFHDAEDVRNGRDRNGGILP